MRRVAALIGVVLAFFTDPVGAVAIGGGTTVGGQVTNGSPEAVVVVGRSGDIAAWSGSSGGGGGRRWRCGYYAFDVGVGESDSALATMRYEDGPVDPEVGSTSVLACFDESGRQVRSLLTTFDPADPFAGIAATERALD